MIQLPDNYPDVYQEFLNGKHAVSKSGFNSVATDMALEQSFNRDSKMKGKNLYVFYEIIRFFGKKRLILSKLLMF